MLKEEVRGHNITILNIKNNINSDVAGNDIKSPVSSHFYQFEMTNLGSETGVFGKS